MLDAGYTAAMKPTTICFVHPPPLVWRSELCHTNSKTRSQTDIHTCPQKNKTFKTAGTKIVDDWLVMTCKTEEKIFKKC